MFIVLHNVNIIKYKCLKPDYLKFIYIYDYKLENILDTRIIIGFVKFS